MTRLRAWASLVGILSRYTREVQYSFRGACRVPIRRLQASLSAVAPGCRMMCLPPPRSNKKPRSISVSGEFCSAAYWIQQEVGAHLLLKHYLPAQGRIRDAGWRGCLGCDEHKSTHIVRGGEISIDKKWHARASVPPPRARALPFCTWERGG